VLNKIKAWWNGLPTWGKGVLLVATGAIMYWMMKSRSSSSSSDTSYSYSQGTPIISGDSGIPVIPTIGGSSGGTTGGTMTGGPINAQPIQPVTPSQPTQPVTPSQPTQPVSNAQIGASALNVPFPNLTPTYGYGVATTKPAEVANETKLNTDTGYVRSEITRTSQVIANRQSAGMNITDQQEYLNRLISGHY